MTIERKGKAALKIRPTIPFAAQILEFNGTSQSPPVYDISVFVSDDAADKCSEQSIGSLTSCKVTISGFTHLDRHMYENQTNWRKIYSIDVSNTDEEGYYMANHRLRLRLKTGGANGIGAQIFSNAIFHDIHVHYVFKFSKFL